MTFGSPMKFGLSLMLCSFLFTGFVVKTIHDQGVRAHDRAVGRTQGLTNLLKKMEQYNAGQAITIPASYTVAAEKSDQHRQQNLAILAELIRSGEPDQMIADIKVRRRNALETKLTYNALALRFLADETNKLVREDDSTTAEDLAKTFNKLATDAERQREDQDIWDAELVAKLKKIPNSRWSKM